MSLTRSKRAWRRLCIVGVLAILATMSAGVARGELTRHGDLIVSLEGNLVPRALPRDRLAPVAVHVEGSVRTKDGSQPPQLRRLTVAINSHGKLSSHGLPVCSASMLQQTETKTALARCGSALIGRGHFEANVALPSIVPFPAQGSLLAFNGRHAGREAILAHIYGSRPVPVTLVLPLTIHRRREGAFGTFLSARFPRIAADLGYVTQVEFTIGRRYRYAGQARSYLSASCAAPLGFPGAIFPFAKGSFAFANGQKLTTALIRDCRVKR